MLTSSSLSRHICVLALLCYPPGIVGDVEGNDADRNDAYNVAWTTPSLDASGSMPLGNGDIGLNAWVETNGDVVFYISKTDAWGDNGRLLKVGRIRVRFEPTPIREGGRFLQELVLRDGTMVVQCGPEASATTIRLWVDAHHPVIHLEARSQEPRSATAIVEPWRTEPYELPSIEVSDVHLNRSQPNGQHAATIVEPDTILTDPGNRLGWYHHNRKSVGPALTGQVQGLQGFGRPDPLLHRTFGAVVTAKDGVRVDDLRLKSPTSSLHQFSVFVLTEHPATPAEWLKAMDAVVATVEAKSFEQRRQAHIEWWRQFWSRSWIHVTAAADAEPAPVIPASPHAVRIGLDQRGGSRFSGTIGRVSLFERALPGEELQELSAGNREKLDAGAEALVGSWTEFPEPDLDTQEAELSHSVTIEAWIRTSGSSNGRIVDRITPGGVDGFLFDTWPGNGLRLIVGRDILSVKDCLQPDTWHHAAVVVDAAADRCSLQMWLDGRLIAEQSKTVGDDATVVSRAYALQRFIDACNGRGHFPIKFNGSIFTVPYEDRPGDADYRRWGPGYWWQNTRLPYLSMCAAGDFEMLRPLFRMYVEELLPLCTYRTKHYFGHGGAYYPECIYFWGDVFSDTYGWTPFEDRGDDKLQTSGWHKWEWVCGPELVWMMCDYYDHTLDAPFLKTHLFPTAHEVLTFFDEHYDVDENGKLVMFPSQAVETWWDCTNPMPELAGLHAVTERLLALPETLTTVAQRAYWTELRDKLPPLPTRELDGVRMLAPAERFEQKRNIENPELYAVFPFRLVALGRPNLDLGIEALRHRWDRGNIGWRQDDLFMAYLGLAAEARTNLVARARRHHQGSRFPAFWGPNYDWIPDQDHGGVLTRALQAMLLQSDGDRIFVLPAWPTDWDVAFKLHAPRKTVIEVSYKDGKMRSLKVQPESRRKDVELFVDPTSTP